MSEDSHYCVCTFLVRNIRHVMLHFYFCETFSKQDVVNLILTLLINLSELWYRGCVTSRIGQLYQNLPLKSFYIFPWSKTEFINDKLDRSTDPPQLIYTQTTGTDRITRADGKANSMQWNIYERMIRNEWTDMNWYTEGCVGSAPFVDICV